MENMSNVLFRLLCIILVTCNIYVLSVSDTAPNIIIFNVDMVVMDSWKESQANKDLEHSVAKYVSAPTPHIDAFRSESIIFPRSYSGAPLCAPSRYSLLSGRYPVRSQYSVYRTIAAGHGTKGTYTTSGHTRFAGDDNMYNLPFTLHSAGYYTALIGKWHLMAADYGGDECDELTNTEDEALYNECTNLVKYNTGFDVVDAFYISNIESSSPYHHNPEWMISQSQKVIQSSIASSQPFFLYIAPTLCHHPSVLTDGDNAFIDRDYTESPKGTLTGDDIPSDTLMMTRQQMYDYIVNEGYDDYDDGARAMWMDDMFGALIKYLKEYDLYDNTFIIFQNDHGVVGKTTLYEQGILTMQFIRYPPLFPVTDGPYILSDDLIVAQYDIPAVIYELTDIDIAEQYVMDGQSWLNDVMNIFNGETNDYECCTERYSDIYDEHSIVTKRYKYIFKAKDNGNKHDRGGKYTYFKDLEQLYDLKEDPSEQNNLIESYGKMTKNQKKKLKKFRRKMNQYVRNIACPLIDDINQCITPNTIDDDEYDDDETLYAINRVYNHSKTLNNTFIVVAVVIVSILFILVLIKVFRQYKKAIIEATNYNNESVSLLNKNGNIQSNVYGLY